MSVPTLKKVKIHVEGMHSTRLKEEKAKTKKPASKGGKASLKNDLDKVGTHSYFTAAIKLILPFRVTVIVSYHVRSSSDLYAFKRGSKVRKKDQTPRTDMKWLWWNYDFSITYKPIFG